MARARGAAPGRAASSHRYARDPHRPGLARSFAAWARRRGVDITALSEEQRIVLEAVRRFLVWSRPAPVLTRVALVVLLHVGLRFPRGIVQAVLGRSVTDKSAWRGLTPTAAAARLRAPDRRPAASGRRKLTGAQVAPIAHFLGAHPQATVVDLHRWITTGPLRIGITRRRLYPALRRLSLAALLAPWGQRKKGALHAPSAPSTPAPSS